MLRWGRGWTVVTWTGASGAPKTPSSNLRSDRLHDEEEAEDEEEETDGALDSCPLTQWPHFPPSPRAWSPPLTSSGSGPSFSGDSASTGLKLPDLETRLGSIFATYRPLPLRRRPDMGDALRAGLLVRDLERPGERPRTTSSFNAEKKPCFFSIFRSLGSVAEQLRAGETGLYMSEGERRSIKYQQFNTEQCKNWTVQKDAKKERERKKCSWEEGNGDWVKWYDMWINLQWI